MVLVLYKNCQLESYEKQQEIFELPNIATNSPNCGVIYLLLIGTVFDLLALPKGGNKNTAGHVLLKKMKKSPFSIKAGKA